MRITKDYDERRNEILDAAERLFSTKGYEKCTVNDILNEVSIAKGTFYYYFKSKKEVLEAIVSRYTKQIIKRVEAVLEKDLRPEEKLLQIFLAMRMENRVELDVISEMHKPENALLHQKTLQQIVTSVAPLLASVVEEGIEKQVWQCKYPLEYMKIFLAATISITDEGIFQIDEEGQMKILIALVSLMEKMLEVPENTFLHMFYEHWG